MNVAGHKAIEWELLKVQAENKKLRKALTYFTCRSSYYLNGIALPIMEKSIEIAKEGLKK